MEGEKYFLEGQAQTKDITTPTTFVHSFIHSFILAIHGVPGTLLVLYET